MNNKLLIAKPGFNALTEADPNNFIFHSDYGTLKYHISGSADLFIDGANAETNITHGLGYIPFFVVYANKLSPSNTWSMCPQTFFDAGAYLYLNAYADSDKIYFRAETASASNTINFYYKVFKNSTGL
jgi:hypothetical protein